MNKIELKFKNRVAIDRGTYFLFAKDDAIDFVKECFKENIGVLGIDGFYKVDQETVQPSMENSLDLTLSSYVAKKCNVYEEAIKFLEGREVNLFFEITCSDM